MHRVCAQFAANLRGGSPAGGSGTVTDDTVRLVVVIAGYLAIVNLVSAFLFWWDKRRAVSGAWRVGERTLHVWAVLGGFVGGIWAIRRFHHKNRKMRFLAVYSLASLGHVAIWAAVIFLVSET